ncbi:cytochrome c peroxidase [Dyadobacter soli]|uniref:Cytochrome c peroxidase n=1 Tax=Dyadobacter soli TaxID=659014 RepID=A0A1G6VQE8_9BACT|nr:cytochrome c peroxidase [Dyadobacter soli]SDD55769.1 cytochrome c peroxidase [Dyadobacter soli]
MKTKRLLPLALLIFILAAQDACQDSRSLPADEIALGKQLFFDPILSSTRQISCSSCHRPENAFADTTAVSLGVFKRKGKRNTPSVMNLGDAAFLFWDGRVETMQQQALIPIANRDEMALPVDSAVGRLRANAFYQSAFVRIYKQQPSSLLLARALAAFELSLETGDTPFDDWKTNDDSSAVSESVKRGFSLFNGKANCVRCHFGRDFANTEFRNIGLFNGKNLSDSGRAAITRRSADLGKFKIGPLRNVALTAPYMHNGMFKTLREVIDYYDNPDKFIPDAINRDTLLARPIGLTNQDKQDLENFLRSLTSQRLALGGSQSNQK